MKTIISSIILSLTLTAAVFSDELGDLTFTELSSSVEITDCSQSATNVMIPETINGKPVTSIANTAFSDCVNLTNITFPENLTSIGEWAFDYCTSLLSVTIPRNVSYIGVGAFGYCPALSGVDVAQENAVYASVGGVLYSKDLESLICHPNKNITSYNVPNGTTRIEDYAFIGCDKLVNVTILGNTTYIGNGAFSRCYDLENISLGTNVITIGTAAFYSCSSLTSVTIPDTTADIGSSAFSGCSSLTDLRLGNSLETIELRAFEECTSLTNIVIGENLHFMGQAVFYNCNKLTEITLPDSLEGLESFVFEKCTSLTNVVFGKNFQSMGQSVFKDCTGLTQITLPASLTYIGGYSFMGCVQLTDLRFLGHAPSCGPMAFYNVPATVSYFSSQTGFTSPTWQGLNTVLILPSADNIIIEDFVINPATGDAAIILSGSPNSFFTLEESNGPSFTNSIPVTLESALSGYLLIDGVVSDASGQVHILFEISENKSAFFRAISH